MSVARATARPGRPQEEWDTVEFEKVAKAQEAVEKAINRDKSRDVKVDPVKSSCVYFILINN